MTDVEIRRATRADLPAVVALLADDVIGTGRETPDDLAPYLSAFLQLDADPRQHLVVAVVSGAVVGTLQLSVGSGLSRRGATRGTVEGVRVDSAHRGGGVGTAMIEWAVEEARRQDCALVQLTSEASRTDAHRLYERLGFTPSHVGFKLALG